MHEDEPQELEREDADEAIFASWKARDVPADLHEVDAFWSDWQEGISRTWREFLHQNGDVRYDQAKALQRSLELERLSASRLAQYFDIDEPEKVENVRVFLRWYGRELILLAASMPGEDGERFRRAAAVVSKDQRPHEQRSQNENRLAKPDQDRFSYQDVAYLAGCSVRQAKRVLTDMYGLERKGARRWFTREQVKAAFPNAIPG